MMRPTSRLAAPVTSSASAPISWTSRGSERQSTERGAATAFGNAISAAPDEIEGGVGRDGHIRGQRAEPREAPSRVVPRRRAIDVVARDRDAIRRAASGLPPSTIRVWWPLGVQAIEEPRQQDRAGAVYPIEPGEVHIDGQAPGQAGACTLHRALDVEDVGQVERTDRGKAPAIAFTIGPNGDAHQAHLQSTVTTLSQSGSGPHPRRRSHASWSFPTPRAVGEAPAGHEYRGVLFALRCTIPRSPRAEP